MTSLITYFPDSFNTLGSQGADCDATCNDMGMVCNPHIVTRNMSDAIVAAGDVSFCFTNAGTNNWFGNDQPGYVSDLSDPNKMRCLGFKQVPDEVPCDGKYNTMRRLCACDLNGKCIPSIISRWIPFIINRQKYIG